MIYLVCGGRDYTNRRRLFKVLQACPDVTHIIHGGARGADELAGEYARDRGIPCTVFKADWDRHGLAAGPIRNQQMLDEGKPDRVVAFPGNRGTADMIRRATAAGVVVIQVDHGLFGRVV